MTSLEPFERDADVVRRAIALLRARLPITWAVETAFDVRIDGRSFDATVELAPPSGPALHLLAESKRSLVTRDLPAVLEQLATAAEPTRAIPVIVSRYLSQSVRNWLDSRDLSYIDATGNIRLTSDEPVMFLRDQGADRDPWRSAGRPRGTLRGVPPTRVVRTLVDFSPPLPIRRLVELSGASTGATYRVLEFLEQEALLTRGPRGIIETVAWRALLERWADDYGFARDNPVTRYLAPRGLAALQVSLAAADEDLGYAVTGSLAAQLWAPYAPPRLATLYIEGDVGIAAKALGLREVDTGANVLLAAATSDVVFDRTSSVSGITYAAPSQVAVDLLDGPGRNPEEGHALLDWMETNESAWRQ